MRALVTGARGFIGRILVDSLLQDGIEVRVLVRPAQELPEQWSGRVEVAAGNLLEPSSLLSAVAQCETVYHLAGEIRDPAAMWKVNKEGTEHLLSASIRAGVRRFLYLSSVGVIGAKGDCVRVDELTSPLPRSLYERSKLAGETAALRCHGAGGLCVHSVRPSTVYGEGLKRGRDSFLAWARLIRRGRFVLFGRDGVNSCVYVGDVVAACRFLERTPSLGGGSFIVNESISLSCFVNEMARAMGVGVPLVLPGAVGRLAASLLRTTGRLGTLCNRTDFSMEKLTRSGFAPQFGYSEGLRRTLEWYRAAGLLT